MIQSVDRSAVRFSCSVVLLLLSLTSRTIYGYSCSANFRVINEYGRDIEFKLVRLTPESKSSRLPIRITRPREVTELDCGGYAYVIEAKDYRGNWTPINGSFLLVRPVQQVTVVVHSQMLQSSTGVPMFSTWDPRNGPFHRGRVIDWITGTDKGWVRIQPVFGEGSRDTLVKDDGRFEIYSMLRGVYVITLTVNGAVTSSTQFVFSGIKKGEISISKGK